MQKILTARLETLRCKNHKFNICAEVESQSNAVMRLFNFPDIRIHPTANINVLIQRYLVFLAVFFICLSYELDVVYDLH